MKIKRIIASEIATLDSDVIKGGGTDVTKELQAALDEALTCGGVHLVMDGAALVSTLRVHSNTTIECLNLSCGFFQKANSNTGIISNYCDDLKDLVYNRPLKNVTLKGGTYNQNCANQAHHVLIEPGSQAYDYFCDDWAHWHYVFGLEFYGVENLTIRDLHIMDFSVYACLIGGFKNVLIENVWLDLPGRIQAHNQDGFHFWGPGQYLTVRNVGGRVGDDFMNLGPDEVDYESSITDVIVDGVFHDDADQSIRMLSRGTGRLDRVTIRNITGTYRSFGFYVNCWFPGGTYGNFGNIFVENVDLRAVEPNYTYRDPMLFSVGGNIECLTVKNLRHHLPYDKRTLFEIGLPYYNYRDPLPEGTRPRMGTFIIDGLTVIEEDSNAKDAEYIQIFEPIDRLILREVLVLKHGDEKNGHLLTFKKNGEIGDLVLHDVITRGFKGNISEPERIHRIISQDVTEE